MVKSTLEIYRQHGIMTEVKTMGAMVRDVPKDIEIIAAYTQNILLHQHWSHAYGLKLSEERKKEPFKRSFEEKLMHLNKSGYSHISEKKPIESKIIGICRDFSVVAAALCREVGIPARERCGFANYLEKGKYIDHWVLEYWNEEKKKWIMADTQMDELQQEALKLPFDPLEVSEDYFITAPRAWLACREGKLNPELFGIFKWWGYDYLRCNLILDANSLLKLPMQPWDMWPGYKSLPIEQWTEKDYELMDTLSQFALKVDDNYQALYDFVMSSDVIKVPENLEEVINGLG